jgi:hypothetical protein
MRAGRSVLGLVGLGAVGSLVLAPAALAQRPDGAGPPTVDESPLVGDPLSLLCGGHHLVFTGGTLIDRAHLSASGDVHGTRHPVDATMSDGAGGVYRLHGTATYRFLATGSGSFTVTGAVTGPAGTYTVNSRFTGDETGVVADERGTCQVLGVS